MFLHVEAKTQFSCFHSKCAFQADGKTASWRTCKTQCSNKTNDWPDFLLSCTIKIHATEWHTNIWLQMVGKAVPFFTDRESENIVWTLGQVSNLSLSPLFSLTFCICIWFLFWQVPAKSTCKNQLFGLIYRMVWNWLSINLLFTLDSHL